MTELQVALLPPLPGEQWSWGECAAELAAYGYPVRIVEAHPDDSGGELDLAGMYVAHCALELAQDPGRPPVVLVVYGGAGRMLAAIGFSQRASRRRVLGYVFVDAELPKAGVADWPDAPVTYIGAREAVVAGLRGWDVLPGDDVAAELRSVAAVSI
ncbi:MAG: hypothetical protein V9E82_07055 [Candidatus Nanopelagicales bacterium]